MAVSSRYRYFTRIGIEIKTDSRRCVVPRPEVLIKYHSQSVILAAEMAWIVDEMIAVVVIHPC